MSGVQIFYRYARRRLRNQKELIPLAEYCAKNNLSTTQVRTRLNSGLIVGKKIANKWWIRPDPYPDE